MCLSSFRFAGCCHMKSMSSFDYPPILVSAVCASWRQLDSLEVAAVLAELSRPAARLDAK